MAKDSNPMATNEDPFTEAITKMQLLALIKCNDCLQHLKDEFLYEYPDRADIFKNIAKISDDDFELLKDHAATVLKESAPNVASYDGFYENLEPFTTINGMCGVYMAWNSGFNGIFFTRKRDALAYIGKSYSEYIDC